MWEGKRRGESNGHSFFQWRKEGTANDGSSIVTTDKTQSKSKNHSQFIAFRYRGDSKGYLKNDQESHKITWESLNQNNGFQAYLSNQWNKHARY